MVFSQLSPNEKDAFFGLLDEYFASRPELFKNGAPGATETAAATAAVHKAFASPAGRAAAQEATAPMLKSFGTSWGAKKDPSPGPSSNNIEEQGASSTLGAGRVAAAAAALASSSRFSNISSSGPPGGAPPPRQPTRKFPGAAESDDASPPPPPPPGPPPRPGSAANRFGTPKTVGDVDTTSTKNTISSLRNFAAANKSAVPTPPAFPSSFQQKKNQFAAPPSRSVSSNASHENSPSAAAPPPPPPPPPPAPRARVPVEEPEGDWAEVLYDYSSEDPEDLNIKEGQRVLIVEKSSDDWWKGELDGRTGLVPAAYVKIV